METQVYPADKVDGMLKLASESLHAVTDVAIALQDENDKLKRQLGAVKQAGQDTVELEKVASHTDASKVSAFVTLLTDHEIIPQGQREKFAAACLESGNNILDIATQALKLSEAPVTQGYGIKQSSTSTNTTSELDDENAAWLSVVAK